MENLYETGEHGQYLVMIGELVRWSGPFAPYAISWHSELKVIKEGQFGLVVRAKGMFIKNKETGKKTHYEFEAGRSMLVPEYKYWIFSLDKVKNKNDKDYDKLKAEHTHKIIEAAKKGAKIISLDGGDSETNLVKKFSDRKHLLKTKIGTLALVAFIRKDGQCRI